jgi:adenylosuccinate synthase
MVDGIDLLAITKLDCLDGFDKVAICTGYEINGKVTDRFPASLDDLTAVKPVYEWHDGWKQDISGARCWEDLPVNARKYLERVAELVRSKIAIISVGPRRDQTFSVEK